MEKYDVTHALLTTASVPEPVARVEAPSCSDLVAVERALLRDYPGLVTLLGRRWHLYGRVVDRWGLDGGAIRGRLVCARDGSNVRGLRMRGGVQMGGLSALDDRGGGTKWLPRVRAVLNGKSRSEDHDTKQRPASLTRADPGDDRAEGEHWVTGKFQRYRWRDQSE